MAHNQMAEQRADDRQPDTIAKHWIDGRWRDAPQHRDSVDPATGEVIGGYAVGGGEAASEDRTTADDRSHEPSGEIAGDARGALIADQHA
jgi:acyl-CoA reductase-like NAD-dependent aldehyde dehydrogenase